MTAAVPVPAARPNPFAGIPISDVVRDGAAALLLLISLALPWNYHGVAATNVPVLLITLLSLASLSITYLARGGVLPPTVTVGQVWALRAAANAPYVLLVVVFLIFDLVGSEGIGQAAGYGLAAVLLATQPREAEVAATDAGAPIVRAWRIVALGFAGFAVVVQVVNIGFGIAAFQPLFALLSYAGAIGGMSVLLLVLFMLFTATAVVALCLLLTRRSEPARLGVLAIGIAFLGAVLIDLISRATFSGTGLESLRVPGFGTIIFCALAGLAAAPTLRIAAAPIPEPGRWIGAARFLQLVSAITAGYVVLLVLIVLIMLGASGMGSYLGPVIAGVVGVLVVYLLIGASSLFARQRLRAGDAAARPLVLVIAAAQIVLGIVVIALTLGFRDTTSQMVQYVSVPGVGVSLLDLVLVFGLPIAVIVLLTVPRPVRSHFGPLLPAGLAGPAAPSAGTSYLGAVAGTPVPAAPVPVPPAPPAPGFTAAQAADPATPADVLYEIAQQRPDLRAYIAANPSAYPGLVDWLGTLGDPEVDAALARR